MAASVGFVREPGVAGTCGLRPVPVGIASTGSLVVGTVGTGSGIGSVGPVVFGIGPDGTTGFTGSSGLTVFPPIIGRKFKSDGMGNIGLAGSGEFAGGA